MWVWHIVSLSGDHHEPFPNPARDPWLVPGNAGTHVAGARVQVRARTRECGPACGPAWQCPLPAAVHTVFCGAGRCAIWASSWGRRGACTAGFKLWDCQPSGWRKSVPWRQHRPAYTLETFGKRILALHYLLLPQESQPTTLTTVQQPAMRDARTSAPCGCARPHPTAVWSVQSSVCQAAANLAGQPRPRCCSCCSRDSLARTG